MKLLWEAWINTKLTFKSNILMEKKMCMEGCCPRIKDSIQRWEKQLFLIIFVRNTKRDHIIVVGRSVPIRLSMINTKVLIKNQLILLSLPELQLLTQLLWRRTTLPNSSTPLEWIIPTSSSTKTSVPKATWA